jgi:hypothetical protein
LGFGEEGSVKLSDVSAMNEQPGLFQVDLVGPNWTVPAGLASRSVSGNTLRLGDTIAVRLSRPVRAADAPEFAAGERAGSAGCASNETQFESWPLDEAGVNASLVGSWAICSGGSGTLRFDASGQADQAPGRALHHQHRAGAHARNPSALGPTGVRQSLWATTLACH